MDSEIANIIKEVAKSKEVNIGFRKLKNGNISLFVIDYGIESCDGYYGTTLIADRKVHLYLYDDINQNELKHLINLINPKNCVLNEEVLDEIPPPDLTLLYEYELIDNEFVKISAW